LLSEIRFGSLLDYSPRGQSEISQRSRATCYAIKSGQLDALDLFADRLGEHVHADGVLAPLFGEGLTLVPMPRSAPLIPAAHWPALRIAQAIISDGLANNLVPALERTSAVTMSSHSSPGERPSASAHYDSLRAHLWLDVSNRILVVDDVVTKGATAIAALSRLAETYPNAELSLLAAIRTRGLIPDIERILNPVVGLIRLINEEPQRDP
jgi:hypothetical protein